MANVTMRGGVRKARQELKRIGVDVKKCRLMQGDARPRYTAYGNLKKSGGRLSICDVTLRTTADHRRIVDALSKDRIIWFNR